jgi:hypothetical protein
MPPIDPEATQQSTAIDPEPHPAAPLSIPLDLARDPLAMPPLAMHPALTPQSDPIDPALQSASAEVKRVARWVIDSGDNGGMPFLLVDKVDARVFAFDSAGHLQGTALALLGMARGDRLLAPNSATMSQMPPQVRITPAGRFVSRLAIDSHGKELLVLDYDASISLHPVVKGTPAEHRAERLVSPMPLDHRISFGCINVPPEFYTTFVHPAFIGTKGVVYVLPEMSPASELFGFHPFDAGAQQGATASNARASQPVSTAAAQ